MAYGSIAIKGWPLARAVYIMILRKFQDPLWVSAMSAGSVGAEAIRNEFKLEYPESDTETIEEAVNEFMRMTDPEVLRPFYRRGPNRGQPIIPFYFTANLTNGQAFLHQHYYSKASMDASFKRGRKFGYNEARNDMAKNKDILQGVS